MIHDTVAGGLYCQKFLFNEDGARVISTRLSQARRPRLANRAYPGLSRWCGMNRIAYTVSPFAE